MSSANTDRYIKHCTASGHIKRIYSLLGHKDVFRIGDLKEPDLFKPRYKYIILTSPVN